MTCRATERETGGTLACVSPTVDSEEDFGPEGGSVKGLKRSWCITSPLFGVNKTLKAAIIQRSDGVPESTYELLMVLTASRQAETHRGICVTG